MAITPEGAVKKQVKAALKSRGALFCMPFSAGYSNAGVSDILACYKGRFISIEVKAGKGKPTALQQKWLDDVHKAGGLALVVNENNIVDVDLLLNLIDMESW